MELKNPAPSLPAAAGAQVPRADKTEVIWGSQDKSTGLLICAFFLPFQISLGWR